MMKVHPVVGRGAFALLAGLLLLPIAPLAGASLGVSTAPESADPAGGAVQASSRALCDELYAYDDGHVNYTLGVLGGASIGAMFLNDFVVQPGAERIDSVSVQYARVHAGIATVLVYSDPNNDGDPHDAVLLAAVPYQVQAPRSYTWETTFIPGLPLVGAPGQHFFVGFTILEDNSVAQEFPAAMDFDTPNNSNWVLGAAGPCNITNLSANSYFTRISPPQTGSLMVRAHGVPNNCPPTWAFGPGESTCPKSVPVIAPTGECGLPVTWTAPTIDTSICADPVISGSVTSTHNPGDYFPVGTTTVTYNAQTTGGDIFTYSFDVVVRDTQPPVLNCPPSYWRVQCNNPVGFIYYPSYVENCPAPAFFGHGPYPYGVTTNVDAYLVDQSGNESNHCTFDIEVVGDIPGPARLASRAPLDGVVLESKAGSGLGGSSSAGTASVAVGDDSANRQSKGVFSFDLTDTPIPSTAIITRAYLRLTQAGQAGTPGVLGALVADHCPSYFGAGPGLANADFEATSAGVTANMVTLPLPPGNGASAIGEIDPSNFVRLNRAGLNQFRLHFATSTAHAGVQDSVSFYTGETVNAPASRPEFVIEYYLADCNPCNLPGAGGPSTATTTCLSNGAEDGYLKESHWTSGVGGSSIVAGGSFNVGDASTREQLVGLLSFDTSSIPANAHITSAQLQLTRTGATGTFGSMGSLVVDMKCGGVFGTSDLEASDFQAYAQFQQVATLPVPTTNGQLVSGNLAYDGYNAIQTGDGALTQMKVRFTVPDNGNAIADYLLFGTGEGGVAARPKLVVTYDY